MNNDILISGKIRFVRFFYILSLIAAVSGYISNKVSFIVMLLGIGVVSFLQYFLIGGKNFSILITDDKIIVFNKYFFWYKRHFYYSTIIEVRVRNDFAGLRIIIETKSKKAAYDVWNFLEVDLNKLIITLRDRGVKVKYFE